MTSGQSDVFMVLEKSSLKELIMITRIRALNMRESLNM